MAEPRTWSLPPEPGPEVTVVRDRHRRIWRPRTGAVRHGAWWVCQYEVPDADWPTLVGLFGPLTDATGEV